MKGRINMKRTKQSKLLAVLLVLTMVMVSLLPTVVFAEDGASMSGICGDPAVNGGKDVTWSFDNVTGTLTISGKGGIKQFSNENERPWNYFATDIKTVTIDEGITEFNANAFKNMPNWEGNFNIPASVTSIKGHFTRGCKKVTGLTVAEGNRVYSTENGVLLKDNGTRVVTLLDCVTNLVIPDSVTILGDYEFDGWTWIESVKFGSGLKSIGYRCFAENTSLKSIDFGSKIETIGNASFYQCTALTGEIIIPPSVTSIVNSAFQGCEGLHQ